VILKIKKSISCVGEKVLGKRLFSSLYSKQKIRRLYKNNVDIYQNKIFKDKHKGDRCFILGNGPSINSQDLTLLENEYVFTVNQISRHKDFQKIKPTYHFWADPIFFNLDLSKDSDIELLNKMKEVNTADNKPICFFETKAHDLIKKTNLDKELNIFYFKTGQPFSDVAKKDIDMTSEIPGFHTVVQCAIASAAYMGFSEIYFLGCETTGILTSVKVRLDQALDDDYAYEVTKNEDERMRSRVEKVSLEQELYSFYKTLSDYKLLYEYCEQKGIKLYNATLGGLVEGVPRVKYENLFREV